MFPQFPVPLCSSGGLGTIAEAHMAQESMTLAFLISARVCHALFSQTWSKNNKLDK